MTSFVHEKKRGKIAISDIKTKKHVLKEVLNDLDIKVEA